MECQPLRPVHSDPDWLVLFDKYHLFTPSVGAFLQIPFGGPVSDDPASHSRVGITLGLEFLKIDLIPNRLSPSIAGSLAGYSDLTNPRVCVWDPSVTIGINITPWDIGPRMRHAIPARHRLDDSVSIARGRGSAGVFRGRDREGAVA